MPRHTYSLCGMCVQCTYTACTRPRPELVSFLSLLHLSLFAVGSLADSAMLVCFLETGFFCVALAVLELTLWPRLASNSKINLPLDPKCWDEKRVPLTPNLKKIVKCSSKQSVYSCTWWHMALIPALGRKTDNLNLVYIATLP